MWLIDEYAKIFRILIWLIPWIPLIKEEIIIVEVIKIFNLRFLIKRIIGAIFCQVSIIRHINQFRPSIISGNQKWKGAAPIFIKNPEFIIIFKYVLKYWGIYSNIFKLIIIAIRINEEAIVWVIKYLMDLSEGYRFLFLFIRGIIDRRLISKPIHMENQEKEEIASIDPKTKELKNNNL